MNKIKHRYLDLRNGWQVIGLLFGVSNFIMISHLALKIELDIKYYAVIIIPFLLLGLVIIGHFFRKKQLRTDMDLNYEKATQAGLTVYYMMESLMMLMEKQGIMIPKEYEERLEYMKRIGLGQA